MKIIEILKQKGLFANDIRIRFKNNQIKLNGEPTQDVDLDVELIEKIVDDIVIKEPTIIDAGDFIFSLLKKNPMFVLQLKMFDFETLSESNVNCELKNILNNFFIIRFSKKDIIVVKKRKV